MASKGPNILSQILAQMNKQGGGSFAEPAKQTIKPSGRPTIAPTATTGPFPSVMKAKFDDLLRSTPPTPDNEVELAFGTFSSKGDFVPGLLSITQFSDLKRGLVRMTSQWGGTFEMELYRDQVQIASRDHIRRREDFDTGVVIFEKKFRPRESLLDNAEWGYRISRSSEKLIDEVSDFQPDLIRDRTRYRFTETRKGNPCYGVSLDLTIVEETSTSKRGEDFRIIIYEVEIERNQAIAAKMVSEGKFISSNVFKASFELILGLYQQAYVPEMQLTLPERLEATLKHNFLFAQEINAKNIKFKNPYKLYKDYWNKPENVKLDNLLYPKLDQYSVTVKLNGTRRFVLITTNGTYAYGPPDDLWKVGPGNKTWDGTLFDGEYYEFAEEGAAERQSAYFVFDILFVKAKDVRQSSFQARLNEASLAVTNLKLYVGDAVMKQFFSQGTFYDSTKAAIADMEAKTADGFSIDGLIFQPPIFYKNRYTHKWKFPELLTIDFLLVADDSLDTDQFWLVVSGSNKDIAFNGTPQHPFDGKIVVPGGELNGEKVANRVVECRWSAESEAFEIIRFRDDRNRPNSVKTAQDVWMDIMDPIPLDTIRGDTLQVMRRFHNLTKMDFLKNNFQSGAVVMDWGSGRGGDLIKWSKLGFSKVFVVEPSEDNLQILIDRKSELEKTMKLPDIEIARSKSGQVLGGENTSDLKRVVGKTRLDGLIAFFSLTFFAKDRDSYQAAIASITSLLPAGGKFIGIVMDGEKTRELLESKRQAESIPDEEVVDYTVPSFSIVQTSEFSQDFGDEIEITINDSTTMVKDQIEWLFYFDVFKKDLAKYGLNLKETGFLDNPPMFTVLSKDSKTFSSLFRYFVFEREGKKKKSPAKEEVPSKTTKTPKTPKTPKTLSVDVDDIKSCDSLVGGADKGDQLVFIGTQQDGLSPIHSLLRATSTDYYELDAPARTKEAKKVKKVLDDSELTSPTKSATPFLFLENQLEAWDVIKELMAQFGVNIFVLTTAGGPWVPPESCQEAYTYPESVVLYERAPGYYLLVARKKEDEVFTVFKSNRKLVKVIKKDLCG